MDFVAWGGEPFPQGYEFSLEFWSCQINSQLLFLVLCAAQILTHPSQGWESSVKVGRNSHRDFGNPGSLNIAAEIFIPAVRPVIPESSPSFPWELRCSIMILKAPNDRASAMSQGKAIAVINYLHWWKCAPHYQPRFEILSCSSVRKGLFQPQPKSINWIVHIRSKLNKKRQKERERGSDWFWRLSVFPFISRSPYISMGFPVIVSYNQLNILTALSKVINPH